MIVIKTGSAVRTMQQMGVKLSKKELDKAQARAINHSLKKGRTQARRAVKQEYNVSTRDLRVIGIKHAKYGKPFGELTAPHAPLPLDAFNPKFETAERSISVSKKGEQKVKDFKRSKKSPRGGVRVEVKKGHVKTIPYAFMVPGISKVFARGEYRNKGGFVQRRVRIRPHPEHDLPIAKLITISVFGTVINKRVMGDIQSVVSDAYPERLKHEIEFIAQRV